MVMSVQAGTPPTPAGVYRADTSRVRPIARLRNAFGDLIREYVAPEDGIVIGKSVNPVGQTGARILHLGIVAPESHDYLRLGTGTSLTETA
jgi:hypothetical protein